MRGSEIVTVSERDAIRFMAKVNALGPIPPHAPPPSAFGSLAHVYYPEPAPQLDDLAPRLARAVDLAAQAAQLARHEALLEPYRRRARLAVALGMAPAWERASAIMALGR